MFSNNGHYWPVEVIYPNLSLFMSPEYVESSPEAVEAAVYEATGGRYFAADMEVFPIIPLIAALAPLIPMVVQGIQSATSRPAQPPRQAPAPRPVAPPARRPPAQPAPTPPTQPATPLPVPPTTQPTPAGGGGDGVMQLLTTLTALLPQVLQAVGSMGAGRAGRESIEVGGRVVPAEAVVHMLKTLSEQVLEQHHSLSVREGGESVEYLRSEDGRFLADPADPLGRANAVFQSLLGGVMQDYAGYGGYGYEQAYDPYEYLADLYNGDGFYDAYYDGAEWRY